VFPRLSKLLNQEDAWAHPAYAAPHNADKRNPLL
jgi:hypothetical protein